MEKEITITLCMDSFTFTYIFSIAQKKGGKFNEFLAEYYIKEIKSKFPKQKKVILKIYLTIGNSYNLTNLLCGGYSDNLEKREMNKNYAQKLRDEFFVTSKNRINPIEVGI
jgi:uncharacterized protein (UPF0128 family)